ncbi:MAG TPA: hypothetical protein VNN25_19495 [Thermoanaerobaculia bacterium]|nr:hypothetical protein [Thermoanaerobaculia bacterium]
MRQIRLSHVLFAGAFLWIGLLLQRGRPLHWDEIEFFRATRWIGEGRIPYAGFWEHHSPLQWFLFAPFARFLATAPGVSAIVVMRWVQVPLWIGVFALIVVISRRVAAAAWGHVAMVAMLLASPLFVFSALEYRVDTLGNACFLAAVALLVTRDVTRGAAIAFGVLGSCAVLANIRMAPLIVIAALFALVWMRSEERWRWNGRALWMMPGVAFVAAAFLGWLRLAGAWDGFLDGVVRYNSVSNSLVHIAANTFVDRLLDPVITPDLAMIVAWIAALAGVAIALRSIRRPSPPVIIALLFIGTVVTLVPLGVHYPYHLQTTYLLMPALGAIAADRLLQDGKRAEMIRGVAAGIVALALLIQYASLMRSPFGAAMDYQDRVMRTVDERTTKSDTVWDGVGYALHRQPAYRYWFLPAGVRLMAENALIQQYDIARDPPAMIVHGYRVNLWMRSFPRVTSYAVHHYVPLYRDLWIPGMSATIEPRPMRTMWRVPASGRYTIYASEILLRHPWFTRPLEYAMSEAEAPETYEIPLSLLPLLPASDDLQWSIDGRSVPAGARTLDLAKGSSLVLTSSLRNRAGILIVPADVRTLCVGPEVPVAF